AITHVQDPDVGLQDLTPLAGPGHEALHEERLEPLLELRGDAPRDLGGRARAHEPFALTPTLEIGIFRRRVVPHGDGIDQIMEHLAELLALRPVAVGGLDDRRDLFPVNDAVAGHGLAPHFTGRTRACLTKVDPAPTLRTGGFRK